MENKNAKSGAFATSSPSCRKYEEVLKYFPDEVFEPIELRPEELVSGEVYTIEDYNGRKWTFSFDRKENNHLHYFKMIFQIGMDRYSNNWIAHVESDKLYHATPEEKALLLGEEQTEKQLEDWKGLYAQLLELYTKKEVELENAENKALEWEEKANTSKTWENTAKNWENAYDQMTEKANDWKAKFKELQKDYHEMTAKLNDLDDKYSKLGAYNDELTEKINQTEIQNNQEKVYIFYNYESNEWSMANELETALKFSKDEHDIYEAIKIGVKKSVLVNEEPPTILE